MSNIQFVVLLATILFGCAFASDDDATILPALVGGCLFGVSFVMWLS